jgi:hypothetical protein
MSFNTPAGWTERCAFLDDQMMHQIRIIHAPPYLAIGCTCTRRRLALIEPGEDAMRAWFDAEHEPQAVSA